MKRIAGAAAAAVMTVAVVSGCGGSSDSNGSGSYCADVKDATTSFTGLSDSNLTQANFDELRTKVSSIADEAPSDVKADWATFSTTLDSFSSALEKAGLTFDDVQKASSGGLSASQLSSLASVAQSLDTADFKKAQSDITANVKSECKIDLNSGNSAAATVTD